MKEIMKSRMTRIGMVDLLTSITNAMLLIAEIEASGGISPVTYPALLLPAVKE